MPSTPDLFDRPARPQPSLADASARLRPPRYPIIVGLKVLLVLSVVNAFTPAFHKLELFCPFLVTTLLLTACCLASRNVPSDLVWAAISLAWLVAAHDALWCFFQALLSIPVTHRAWTPRFEDIWPMIRPNVLADLIPLLALSIPAVYRAIAVYRGTTSLARKWLLIAVVPAVISVVASIPLTIVIFTMEW